jgi:hypothetical protein
MYVRLINLHLDTGATRHLLVSSFRIGSHLIHDPLFETIGSFLTILSVFLAIIMICVSGLHGPPDHSSATHPYRTFNAIHSALRQWESSLNHNGMSCFIATIPQNIRLYHGSDTDIQVSGLTWLAFDVRHALMFTKSHTTESFASINISRELSSGSARSVNWRPDYGKNVEIGWQHEYATKKALRVLYFDGLAAAKTTMGTLDMQDMLLDRDGQGVFSDYTRAQQICALLRKDWKAEIDGFMRMEHGIEIILCESDDKLTLVRESKRRVADNGMRSMNIDADGLTEYFRTVFARDRDFGRSKAFIQFDTMVTAHSYIQDELLTTELPRLFHVSQEYRLQLKTQIKAMVQISGSAVHDQRSSPDWQTVTDLITSQYSDILLRPSAIKAADILSREIETILSPFIEDTSRFPFVDVSSCASQYMPVAYHPSTASRSILTVSSTICRTLAKLFELKNDLATSQSLLQELRDILGWSTWQRCGTCGSGEYCWIPVWPLGTVKDREKPTCRSEISVSFNDRYWK